MQPPLTPSGLKFKLSVAVESQGLGLQLADEEGRVGTFAAYLIRTKLAAGAVSYTHLTLPTKRIV